MTFFTKTLIASAFAFATLSGLPIAQAEEVMVGTLKIENTWSREMPPASEVAAGFMTITNTGTQDDRLVSATSDISEVAQIHEMVMQDDVMKMKEVEGGLVIPAGQSVVLKPKSLHIMFIKLKSHPKAGETFDGTLTFDKAGIAQVKYHVDPMGTMR